jgi:hypothetical protein
MLSHSKLREAGFLVDDRVEIRVRCSSAFTTDSIEQKIY